MAKTILITGCSSGIGHAAALILKKRGYRVFATARKEEDVTQLKSEGFESLLLDVTDSTSIQNALNQILQKTGGTLDALFNNAGYLFAGAIEDLTREMIRAQFETNVFGPMELIRLVLPIMRKQGQGRIIQNSSILGFITLPYYGAYNASKFALEGFSHTLRQELRGTAIFVSIIHPGPIVTALRKRAYQHYQQTLQKQHVDTYEEVYQKLEHSYFQTKKNKLALSPDAIAKPLIHALENAHPKIHYYLGMPSKLLAVLKRILPDKMLDWILCRVNGG